MEQIFIFPLLDFGRILVYTSKPHLHANWFKIPAAEKKTCCPQKALDQWSILLDFIAIQNGMFVLSFNKVQSLIAQSNCLKCEMMIVARIRFSLLVFLLCVCVCNCLTSLWIGGLIFEQLLCDWAVWWVSVFHSICSLANLIEVDDRQAAGKRRPLNITLPPPYMIQGL